MPWPFGSLAFLCLGCLETYASEQRCVNRSEPDLAYCLRCCHCDEHEQHDVPGRVVWTPQHGWRGLHDSPHLKRRWR